MHALEARLGQQASSRLGNLVHNMHGDSSCSRANTAAVWWSRIVTCGDRFFLILLPVLGDVL